MTISARPPDSRAGPVQLKLTPPGAKPEDTPPPDRVRSVAHLAHTVRDALGHIARHIAAAQAAATDASREFNLRHAANHTADAAEHTAKLIAHLAEVVPGAGPEMDALDKAAGEAPPSRAAPPGDYEVTLPPRRPGPEPL